MVKRSVQNSILILVALCCSLSVLGQDSQIQKKSFEAVRAVDKIKVDGIFDEASWGCAPVLTDFVQRRPSPGVASGRKSEVRFVYDDEAIYISAKLYEKKDQVFNLLTNRDNIGNSDYFGVVIDPFNAGLNGVGLFVTVAGVQYDAQYSNGGNERIWRNDNDWNAVWLSETKVFEDYWTVEYKIPYAVLRFKSNDVQDWGINFFRKSTFLNEDSFWNPIDPEINGFLNQAGEVNKLEGIETPTRLFFYPYISTVLSRSTETGFVTPQLNGGLDIKYGINDAFSLDMTLIPDFSGVRSDNQVLNLSPFEVRFDEQRQFFTEGFELFNKAGLFFSRRVGTAFGHLSESLGEDEIIKSRPLAAQLLNASKITGRTNGGLGIGFFNAISKETLVEVENTETGEIREVVGDPLTNFNVLVLDQNLKNNSSVTLTNTNVWRGRDADDANVTGVNLNLRDKTLSWRLAGFYGYSQVISHDVEAATSDNKTGFKYNVSLAKTRGNFQFNMRRSVESDTYDINDLGFLRRANRVEHGGQVSYNQFSPQGIFNSWTIRSNINYNQLYEPNTFTDMGFNINANGQFKNFWWLTAEVGGSPRTSNDFFEARTSGYVFKRPNSQRYSMSFRSDGRKQFSANGRYRVTKRPDWNMTETSFNLTARIRIGERAEISQRVDVLRRDNNRGYVTRFFNDGTGDLENVIFGIRDRRTLTNTTEARYIFSNRMGVTFRLRHNWDRVEYRDFLELTEDDEIIDSNYTGLDEVTNDPLHNRNFNVFNIDMEYNWQFLPGSEIRAIWKRSIGTNDLNTQLGFFENFDNTIGAPNFDTITIRLVYFIDYLNVKNIFRK
ncbi:DUF5916 domain-containing protein [Roseivirga sp. E12]|uniref:DUF5916 domain-containing protein n=1 Tax=Roseivirga sp. E12 TaxID=2819237 RepID=UPI001ABC3271|nr:DUF5916 domain-containing protein [Roseivirga sp. E12]MBO3700712.1 carbohydrate binding family 9 domain-containing protein [Roseivirga sp. E12]